MVAQGWFVASAFWSTKGVPCSDGKCHTVWLAQAKFACYKNVYNISFLSSEAISIEKGENRGFV